MSDVSAALAELAEMSERLRAIPGAIEAAIPHMAREVDDYLQECADAGIDPDGKPWPKTELGRKARITGTKREVGVVGMRIYARVTGHDAMHTSGTARGNKVRRLLPIGPVPPKLAARLRDVVNAEISKAVSP